MKIFKYICAALVALPLISGLVSCSESEADYDPAKAIAGSEVYFTSATQTVEISADENIAYVDIRRVKTSEKINVPLKTSSSSATTKVANSVSFAEGSNIAHIAVSYDPTTVEAGHFDTLQIAIDAEDYTTPYGADSVTVLFGKALTWTSLGTGKFYDGWYPEEPAFVDVTIEQCDQNPKAYRVVDPYKDITGEDTGDEYFYFYAYNEGDQVRTNYTAPFDGFAYFDQCDLGVDYGGGYGNFIVRNACYWSSLRATSEQYNLVKDYFDDGSPAYFSFTAYYGLTNWGFVWDETTTDGVIKVLMPGYEITDYHASIQCTGKYIANDGNKYAVVNADYGTDAFSAKIGLYPGVASEEGFDYVMANGQEVESCGEYKLALPEDAETGKYTVYIISLDDAGSALEYGSNTFKYIEGSEYETYSPKYIGTWTYTLDAFAGWDEETETTYPVDEDNLILYQSDQDPNSWVLQNIWGGGALFFEWDQETNEIEFETQCTDAYFGEDYGYVYAEDLSLYGFDPSYYDPETKTFHFDIYYWDEAGYGWGYGFETFKITNNATDSSVKAAKRVHARKSFAKPSTRKPSTKVMSPSRRKAVKLSSVPASVSIKKASNVKMTKVLK